MKLPEVAPLAAQTAMARDDIKAMGRKIAELAIGHDALKGEIAKLVAKLDEQAMLIARALDMIGTRQSQSQSETQKSHESHDLEPWLKAGVSRSTWFRKHKKSPV